MSATADAQIEGRIMKMFITALVLATVVYAPVLSSSQPQRAILPLRPIGPDKTIMVIIGDTHWKIGTGPTAGESSGERGRE